jgi:uncharacterized RmlC-like cupin family protein
LLSGEDLVQLLRHPPTDPAECRIVRQEIHLSGGVLLPNSYGNRISDFLVAVERGYSISMIGIERHLIGLQSFVADLSMRLSTDCWVNLYATPPGAQGFTRHADDHDVLVLQRAGAKEWTVVLPSGEERRIVLRAGDTLYIPTGFPHEAASRDVGSIHMTVGVPLLSAWSTLSRLLRAEKSRAEEFDTRSYAQAIGETRKTLRRLLEMTDREIAAVDKRALLRSRQGPPSGHRFDHLLFGRQPEMNTWLVRTYPGPLLQHHEGRAVVITFPGGRLRLPAKLSGVVSFVCKRARFRPRDLPGLADDAQLMMAQQFVHAGLVAPESRR